jgi:hypothetical protein
MKKFAHSDTKVITSLSTENKIHKNEELVAFLRLDEAARSRRLNFATLSRMSFSRAGEV